MKSLLRFLTRSIATAFLLLAFAYWVQLASMDVNAAVGKTDWSYARYPIEVKDFEGYTSPFGNRFHPVAHEWRMHYGLDIAAATGVKLKAWWRGTVVAAGDAGGCGNEVLIKSGNWESRYCHMNSVSVKVGDTVNAGDIVGEVGATGGVTGPHLHWEVSYKEKLMDPGIVIRAMQASDKGEPSVVASSHVEIKTFERDASCTDCML